MGCWLRASRSVCPRDYCITLCIYPFLSSTVSHHPQLKFSWQILGKVPFSACPSMFFSRSCLPSYLDDSSFTQVFQMHPRVLAWKWRKCHEPRVLPVWGVCLFMFEERCNKFCLPRMSPQNEKRNKTKSKPPPKKKVISLFQRRERKRNSLKAKLTYLSHFSGLLFFLHGKS